MMRLHSYYRSSAAYRVRIALNLKGLEWETVAVNLLKGEHLDESYRAVNPQGRVPALETDDGILTQSPAILEYLEECYPEPPLLPAEPWERAKVRQLANIIACDIHPLNNLGVLKYLKSKLGAEQTQVDTWYAHWIQQGFAALETLLTGRSGDFCHGDAPTLADCHLIPQLYNAHRFNVPLDAFPTLLRIEEHCLSLDAFKNTAPEKQADA